MPDELQFVDEITGRIFKLSDKLKERLIKLIETCAVYSPPFGRG